MKLLKVGTWILLIAVLLAGCTNGETPTDAATAPATVASTSTSPELATSTAPAAVASTSTSPELAAATAYPGQDVAPTPPPANLGYPGPDSSLITPTATVVPTPLTLRPPADGMANIHGILTAGVAKQPDVANLLLAKAVAASQPGFPPMLSFSDDNSPHAVQDSTGLFVFFDVAPGQYGLVISSPIGGAVISDPNTNPATPLLITVKAGDNIDLGTLNTP